jgi:hypothetical protein
MNFESRKGLRKVDRRLVGIVLSVAIVVVAVILVTQSGGSSKAEGDSTARILDVDEVLELANSLGHPIYWAGSIPGDQLEVTQAAGDNVYLRYLPEGVEAGSPNSSFLTIGTYPVPNAQEALARAASKAGSTLSHVAGGGLAFVNPEKSTSVYLAYSESDLQLEVYDPAPGAALGLVHSGKIRPVG